MSLKKRLERLGIVLPTPPEPVGLYAPLIESERYIFVSGMLPFKDGVLMAKGRVPVDVSIEEAQICARQIVLNLLALIEKFVGLERIETCIRVNGYVASTDNFFQQPLILNAASELLNQIFGKAHTRSAIGVSVLPMNSPLEMDFILVLKR